MTLETLRLIVVAGLAVWGAQDLCRRLLRWSEAGDVEHIERHAERRRALSDVGRGPVKQQVHMVCPACRIVFRVTLTVWRDGLAEHQPTRHEWLTLTRGATAAKADFRCRLCGKTFTTRGSQTRHWLANHARHVNEAAM